MVVAAQLQITLACPRKACVKMPFRRGLVATEMPSDTLQQVGDRQASRITGLLRDGIPFFRRRERTAKVAKARQEEMSGHEHAQALFWFLLRMRELQAARD